MTTELWKVYTVEKHNRLNYSKVEYILFLFVGICISLAVSDSSGIQNLPIIDRLLVYAKFIWLAYLPVALITSYGILRYNPREDILLERRKQNGNYKVIFQIVTRGFNREAVKRSVRSILYWASMYLKDYEVWVVTEDDVDREFFDGLKTIDNLNRVKVIYVPKEYITPRKTKYKARALQYALELRRKIGYISNRIWIYLMDEESIVGEDTVLGIIDFIESGKSLIGQGLIVYSNFWGANRLTSLEDSLRSADDITRYKLQAKFGKVFVGVHGSHLLYRSDLEDKIGWDFGKVRAEDAIFGLYVNERFGNVWGWLKGKLYEQSPFSIRDFLIQRRRWLWGKLDIIFKDDKIGKLSKFILIVHLISWLSSLPSVILTYVNVIHPTPIPHPATSIAFGFCISTLVYLYWEGFKLNTEPIGKDRSVYRILNILLIPIIAPLEGIAAWYGLITYRRSQIAGFEVIKK